MPFYTLLMMYFIIVSLCFLLSLTMINNTEKRKKLLKISVSCLVIGGGMSLFH